MKKQWKSAIYDYKLKYQKAGFKFDQKQRKKILQHNLIFVISNIRKNYYIYL